MKSSPFSEHTLERSYSTSCNAYISLVNIAFQKATSNKYMLNLQSLLGDMDRYIYIIEYTL